MLLENSKLRVTLDRCKHELYLLLEEMSLIADITESVHT